MADDDDIKYERNLTPPILGGILEKPSGWIAEDEDGNKGYGDTKEKARDDLKG